jgi:hypothetical protein
MAKKCDLRNFFAIANEAVISNREKNVKEINIHTK